MRRPLLLALLGTLAGAASATTQNTLELFVSPNFSGGSGAYANVIDGDGLIQDQGSATGGFGSSGAGSVAVDWGWVDMAGNAAGSLNTVIYGIFRDSVTINAPGVSTGTPGTLTFSLSVDGNLDAGTIGLNRASWKVAADLGGGAFDLGRGGHLDGSPSGTTYFGDAFGTYSATVTFQYGFAAPLYVELDGSAQASYGFDPGVPSASFAMLRLGWGGIGDLTANGVPVSGATIASASGTDYSQAIAPAVPEPATGLLLLAGLGVVAGRSRRRCR